MKLGRDCNHEITSRHRIGVVAYERRPALGRSCLGTAIISSPGPVLADGSRGHEKAQLEIEFRRYSPLAAEWPEAITGLRPSKNRT